MNIRTLTCIKGQRPKRYLDLTEIQWNVKGRRADGGDMPSPKAAVPPLLLGICIAAVLYVRVFSGVSR